MATRLEELPKPEKQLVFVGFNAFTAAEERLIKHYITQHQALIFWDIDAYYLEDRQQEAGLFLRQYRKDPVFGPTFPQVLPDHIRGKAPHIHCYASSLKTMQAQLVGDILADLPEGQKWQETVVILPDEQLLFPVLHALPDQVDKVNVTMGYPVKNAPIYAFLEACVELQGHMREQGGEWVCYHQPLRDLLRSVYLKDAAPEFVDQLLKEMLTQNRVYLPLSRLQAGGPRFERVFQQVEPGELAQHLADFVRFMAEELQGDTFQQAYLFQCYKQLLRLDDTLRQEEIPNLELRFFIRLFRQLFREVKLPFDGEPLGGLQLMGVLESRNLDFKRLIICDLNEASFPPSGGLNSMIPYTLRKAFRLPVQEQNDAIYAYTFYRLLHQAEEIHLIYAQQGDAGKLMERSRYLEQLRVELP
ncbi:hypothetical protein [Nitritalea halalkaliphila]|uniref:hypothetical protein n=1 Tax=Nitritalea halalkaliphila TaxID=590849 RepID=UPI001EE67EA5|nr:hypothetical protein [Nitritalea halalkaliphila]